MALFAKSDQLRYLASGNLCRDPTIALGGRRPGDHWVSPSASQMGRFETKWLSQPQNLTALADLPGQWVDKVHQRRPPKIIVLGMDSSESPTYGEQEDSAYNGHFGCTCYHPLFVFNQFGDVERCALRPGNVHSADGWRVVLELVVARYRETVKRLYFRGDAAFANPEIYEFLEAEGIGYTIRLPANRVLQDKIGCLLERLVGRPPHEVRRYFASFGYQGAALEEKPPGCGQGRTASGRAIPACGLHRQQSGAAGRARHCLLQSAWHSGAMDQRGHGRDQVDPAVARHLRRQRRAPSASRPRLQPRKFHADAGNAEGGGAVVADQPAREADQDWREGRQPRSLRHLPAGRGRGIAKDVRGHPVSNRPAAGAARPGMTGLWGRRARTTTGEVLP
jgi:Transposase DDE domain group 1